MTIAVRIALGVALGALLGSLPFLHYRAAGDHVHDPATPVRPTGGSHAHHTH